MSMYRARLKCLSALSTPLFGDTLFGHVCWGIARHEGEESLTGFFAGFDEGIPLALSNGFPEGLFPAPVVKPKMIEDIDLSLYHDQKKAKKIPYIPAEWILSGSWTEGMIRQEERGFLSHERSHNTIHRITGTTGEDSLYSLTELWAFEKGKDERHRAFAFDVYVASTYPAERVSQLLEWGLENGYGADRSTGKGHVELQGAEAVRFPEQGNRAMALGPFLPGDKIETLGMRYELFTRFGKLSGDYLLSDNPFKKPVVMFAAGTTLKATQTEAVGTLLRGVHGDERIRHGAVTPVIRFNDPGEEGEQ